MYVVLLTNVEEAGYSSLTAVQCQTIPAALHGRDLLVQATTGSGKSMTMNPPPPPPPINIDPINNEYDRLD